MARNNKFIDLTGKEFGKLTVIEFAGRDKHKRPMWLCRCSCKEQNEVIVISIRLSQGIVKCCNCSRNGIPYGSVRDLTGYVFGRLTIIKYLGSDKHNKSKWLCKCSCPLGKEVEVMASNLTNGNTQSCGCIRLERSIEASQTHRMTGTPEYHSWWSMRARCYDKNNNRYERYGGRGIKVCERWLQDKQNFFDDMGPQPKDGKRYTIERIDSNGDYTPENCKWATYEEQANNTSTNRWIEYNGQKFTIAQLAKKFNINPSIFLSRIDNGWDIELAGLIPIKHKNIKLED